MYVECSTQILILYLESSFILHSLTLTDISWVSFKNASLKFIVKNVYGIKFMINYSWIICDFMFYQEYKLSQATAPSTGY